MARASDSTDDVPVRSLAPAIMNKILIVFKDASVKPSAVIINGPTVKMTFPLRNRRLLKKVNVRNMLIGIHPFFRLLIGILKRRRKITAKIML